MCSGPILSDAIALPLAPFSVTVDGASNLMPPEFDEFHEVVAYFRGVGWIAMHRSDRPALLASGERKRFRARYLERLDVGDVEPVEDGSAVEGLRPDPATRAAYVCGYPEYHRRGSENREIPVFHISFSSS